MAEEQAALEEERLSTLQRAKLRAALEEERLATLQRAKLRAALEEERLATLQREKLRAALEEERLAALQRAKQLEERLAALGQDGSTSSKEREGEDSDIECLGEHAKEIDYHGTNTEWHPLQKKLIR